jgi:hypothetical protein
VGLAVFISESNEGILIASVYHITEISKMDNNWVALADATLDIDLGLIQ